jgi:hypothetical protein
MKGVPDDQVDASSLAFGRLVGQTVPNARTIDT